jgi:hypothetical protein
MIAWRKRPVSRIVFLVSVTSTVPLLADVIMLKDGKAIEGTVQDKADVYEVATKFGALTIRKEEVARIIKDAAALTAEAGVLRSVAASLAEEALKGGVAAEDRDRKLSAAEELRARPERDDPTQLEGGGAPYRADRASLLLP